MIQKIRSLFRHQYRNINTAALVLAGFTLLSQVFGLWRDRLLAGRIGPGDILDTYVTAFQIPDLVFAIGASLVSVTILIPFITERLNSDNGEKKAREFLNAVFSVFLVGIIFVSAILFVVMPWVAPIVAPGFSAEMMPDLVKVARIMLLSPILLGISNLFGSVTQTYRNFFVYALSPIVYNIGIIVGIVFLYPIMGITGLAYGVVIGALFHLLAQVPVIVEYRFVPRLVFRSIQWPIIKEVTLTSLPRTLALAFAQIIVTVLIALATRFGEGAASIFRFALTLNAVPVALIGMSFSVAAFPALVDLYTKGDLQGFVQMVIRPAQKIIFWSIPMIGLFIVFRAQIVRILFGTGAFDWSHTRMTAAVLAVLVLSVAARGLIGLFVRGYYAAGKTWMPFWTNAFSAVFTIGLAVFGIWMFDHVPQIASWFETVFRVGNVDHAHLLVLGLAYSIGTCVNVVFIWFFFRREFKIPRMMSRLLIFSRMTLESLAVAFLMGLVGYLGLQVFSAMLDINTFAGIFTQAVAAGAIAVVAGYLGLLALESRHLPRRLRFGLYSV